jgi:hypothetical protein
MPANVRVSGNGDSHAGGRARLRLKLGAIAYVNARHGLDADAALSSDALSLLCSAAFEYYEVVTGADPRKRPIDPHLQRDSGKLKVAAIAYVNSRHGIDADVGLARAGLALLCHAAIEVYEALMAAPPRKRAADPYFQLDNGTNGA